MLAKVPPKLLLPIFEHAALEEDPGLAERWAALLANAAHADSRAKVRPIYVDVLASLTPFDAEISEDIANLDEQRQHKKPGEPLRLSGKHAGSPPTLRITDVKQAISTLISFGLIEQTIQRFISDSDHVADEEMSFEAMHVRLTVMGEHFLRACHIAAAEEQD